MKKISLVILALLATASMAMAQITLGTGTAGTNTPPVVYGGDELGAHNGYGRGCVMCHAPHGGSLGNGIGVASGGNIDPNNGAVALWGEDMAAYYGKNYTFAGSYAVTLPASGSAVSTSDTNSIVLLCLSCHDGVQAKAGMMKGTTVEALPFAGSNPPTLFGTTPGNSAFNYVNEHPVGNNANVQCNGGSYVYGWDCTGGGNSLQPIEMNGTGSSAFLKNNPSSFWNAEVNTACGAAPLKACTNPTGGTNTWGYNTSHNPLSTTSGVSVNNVTCTTCHNQHDMIVWNVGGVNYNTMFFIRGYYNPYNGGNSVAQFCRNCHGGNSNEMAGLLNIPTW